MKSWPRKELLFSLILLAYCAGFLEAVCFIFGKYLESRFILFKPVSIPSEADYARYLAIRDPALGWPPPASIGHGEIDVSGSRLVPSYPQPGHACLSVYGDSFTWGNEVQVQDGWTNKLAQKLRCRVANYGTGGYGTDQSFLRFKLNSKDEAPAVLLAYVSENIVRNVNQMRDLIAEVGGGPGFKPRFITTPDGIKLVPIPTLTYAQLQQVKENSERFLPCEFFTPGNPPWRRRMTFPYAYSVLSAIARLPLSDWLRDRPLYTRFYDPAHPAKGLEVSAAILAAFAKEASARGKKGRIILLPMPKDLLYYQKNGAWTYQNLIDRLRTAGVPAFNLGPDMIARLQGKNPCDLATQPRCHGHYTPAGNEIIADIVARHWSGGR